MPRKTKDLKVLRDVPQFRDMAVKKIKGAHLKNYGGDEIVWIAWDLNEEATRDQMFKISIDGHEAILDYEELLHYTRLI